ncbi:MAG TPA: hypothetical protein VEL07_14710 [Planctomycetota bacterium]|nr:hypothetical protein [Planctomycetota bacterium]
MIWLKLAALIGLWLVVPAATAWLARRGDHWRRAVIALLVFSFCWQPLMTFGYQFGSKYNVRGWEFGVPEMIAAGLLVANLDARHVLRWLSPVLLLWLLHLAVLVAAAITGISFETSAWYLWRMARATFVFLALIISLRGRRDFEAAIIGLALTALWNEWVVLLQKYAWGKHQTRGVFDHQNMMGMYMILVGTTLFSVWIFRAASTGLRWALFIAFVASTHSVFAGLSRGSMFFYALAVGATAGSAFIIAPDRHKLRALGLLGAVVAIGAVFMANAVVARFQDRGNYASGRMREVMNVVADQMHRDHPLLGLGPNNYALAVNHQRYARTFDIVDRERGLQTPPDLRRGLVESLYHGMRAESGTLGHVTLVLFLVATLVLMLYKVIACVDPLGRALALAAFWSLSASYAQCTLEHTLLHAQNLYLWLTLVAIGVAIPRRGWNAVAPVGTTRLVVAAAPRAHRAPAGPGFWV